MSDQKLTIELVPETCWHSNLRSELRTKDWNFLRKRSYHEAGYQCEICNGVGRNHPVECHEIWHYDDESHIQTLKGLISLCPSCHLCKHMGFARLKKRESEAEEHLATVNGWDWKETAMYVGECFDIWKNRSQYDWDLDLSWLNQWGITAKHGNVLKGSDRNNGN